MGRFEDQQKKDQQFLFREKEVDNLANMIYGEDQETAVDDYEAGLVVDTNRYDVHPKKLDFYLDPSVKKLLKSKFVTGQSSD